MKNATWKQLNVKRADREDASRCERRAQKPARSPQGDMESHGFVPA